MKEQNTQEIYQNPPESSGEVKGNLVSHFKYTGQQRVVKSRVKGVGLIVQQACAYVLQEPDREPVVILEWENVSI